MLFGHSQPLDGAWTVLAPGTIVGPSANLNDGRPDTLSAFTWPTGAQNTGTICHIRREWTSGAIVPRVVYLSNVQLPVGTKIMLAFRRAADGVGTFPYTPAGSNTLQRIVAGPRGELTAAFLINTGATAVVGIDVLIYNDVNGSASIAPGAPFNIGEIQICAGDDVVVDKDWSIDQVDPLTANYSWSRQPYTDPGCPYRVLSFKLAPSEQKKVFGDPSNPTATDYQELFAKLDRGKSCVYIARYIDENGAFSAQLLHRTTFIGIATKLPKATHKSGRWFDSDQVTVIESPIPT